MDKELLIKSLEIKERTADLARSISGDYRNCENLLAAVVLKGAFIFAADLIKNLRCPTTVAFIKARSYDGMKRNSGSAEYTIMEKDLFRDREVLIVEDIVDTGETLHELIGRIRNLDAADIKICLLLHKQKKTQRNIEIDYKGFEIPDRFVIGYELDWNERYKNSKDIFAVKGEMN